jgi:hypothetical protein
MRIERKSVVDFFGMRIFGLKRSQTGGECHEVELNDIHFVDHAALGGPGSNLPKGKQGQARGA